MGVGYFREGKILKMECRAPDLVSAKSLLQISHENPAEIGQRAALKAALTDGLPNLLCH